MTCFDQRRNPTAIGGNSVPFRRMPSATAASFFRAVLLLALLACGVANAQQWRSNYFTSFEQGSLSTLPYGKYTHMFLIGFNCANGVLTNDGWLARPNDWPALRSGATAAGTKLIINIGPNDLSACTTSSTIDGFVNSIVNFISGKDPKNNPNNVVFDGVDLDWEANVQNSTAAAQYLNLVTKLRAAIGTRHLSMAVWYGIPFNPSLAPNAAPYLDQINVMCYDTANGKNDAGQAISWYNAAIYGGVTDVRNACDQQIQGLHGIGIPYSKLGAGIPHYGYAFSGCTQPMQTGCAYSSSQIHYNQIVTNGTYWNGGANKRWDSTNKANYLSIAATNQFLTYADTDYIQALVTYGKNLGLGGYMTFNLMMEYMSGASGDAQYPLSAALYQAATGGATTGGGGTTGSAPSITSASPLGGGTMGAAYSSTLSATGTTPITWSVISGSLPAGLTLSQSTGVISGTPSAGGTSNFTVRASNSYGTNDKAMSLAVAFDPYAFWKFDAGSGTVAADSSGNGISAQLVNAPAWLGATSCKVNGCISLNGSNQYGTAKLDLSATSAVTLSFWMNWNSYANDDRLAAEFTSNFNNSTVGFMVDPNSSAAGGGQFEAGLRGDVGYNQVVFARPSAGAWHHYAFVFNKAAGAATQVIPYVDGAAVPYTKTTSSANTNKFGADTLYLMSRAGSSLFGAGAIDEFRVYKRALSASEIQTLAAGASALQPIAPVITTTSLPQATVGAAYSQTLGATGSTPMTWSISSGTPPAGVTLSSSGVLSGAPSASGTFNFTVQASNSAGSDVQALTLTVATSGSAPIISTATQPPQATVGVSYSFTFTATGTAPITWTVAGGALPAGLTLSQSGVLSGTPSAAGTYSFTVKAANSAGSTSQVFSMTVTTATTAPAIRTVSPLPQGTVASAYSYTLSATGTTPMTWSLVSGSLPAGLSLSSSGVLSGTPTTAATYTFTVQVSNAAGKASQTYSLTILAAQPPSVSIINPASGVYAKGTTQITVYASSSVKSVQYRLDGVVFATVTVAPFTYNWNTTGLNSGWHTFDAVATGVTGATAKSQPMSLKFQ